MDDRPDQPRLQGRGHLNAVIEGKNIELDERWLEVGKTLELSGTDQNIILECEGDRLFRGRLGQARGTSR